MMVKTLLIKKKSPNILNLLVSSTKIRKAVRRGNSVKYLVGDPVIEYMDQNNLYLEE